MALTKNLNKEQKVMKLAAKLIVANLVRRFIANMPPAQSEQATMLEDALVDVAGELSRNFEPSDSVKGNITIARDYYERD